MHRVPSRLGHALPLVLLLAALVSSPCFAGAEPDVFVQTGHHDFLDIGGLSADGEYLATYTHFDWNDWILLWHEPSGLQVRAFPVEEDILAAKPSFDGSKLLVVEKVDESTMLRCYDAATGELESELASSLGFRALLPLPDRNAAYVAVQPEQGNALEVVLWQDGQCLPVARVNSSPLLGAALAPDGALLLASQDRILRRLDPASGELVNLGEPPLSHDRYEGLCPSPDGGSLLCWSPRSNTMHLVSLPGLEPLAEFTHVSGIGQGLFSPDGNMVLAMSDSTAVVWDVETGNRLSVFAGPMRESRHTVAFTPDSGAVLMGGMPATDNPSHQGVNVHRFDPRTGRPLASIQGNAMFLDQAWVVPDKDIALISGMGSAFLWDLDEGRLVDNYPIAFDSVSQKTGRRGTAASLSRDGQRMTLLTDFGSVYSYDCETGTRSGRSAYRPEGHYEFAALQPDGRLLYLHSAYVDVILVNDPATGETLADIPVASGDLYASRVSFSPDSSYMLISDRITSVVDLAARQELARLPANCAAFFADNSQMLLGRGFQHDGGLALVDWPSQALVREYARPDGSAPNDVTCLALSPDNRLAAIADGNSAERGIELWDVESGEYQGSLMGHATAIRQVEFLGPDRLLSVSMDGTARLWDLGAMAEIARFIAFPDGEWVVITPEGYYSASGNGHERVNVALGQDVYTMAQFYDVFYRPDIVRAKLRGEDIAPLISLTMADALAAPPPSVTLQDLPQSVDSATLDISYAVESQGGGIGDVRVFVNAKLVESDGFYRPLDSDQYEQLAALSTMDGRALVEQNRNFEVTLALDPGPAGGHGMTEATSRGDSFQQTLNVDLVPGGNTVSICAFNSDNTVQSMLVTRTVTCEARPGERSLFVMCVGVNDYKGTANDLAFAVPDAQDMAENLRLAATGLVAPERIHLTRLLDQEATRQNILAALQGIAAQAGPGDGFVLFLAGHGILAGDHYSFVTSEFAGTLDGSCVVTSADLVEASKRIKAMSQLMVLDTCHAGSVDYLVSGLYDARISTLARQLGLHIFASCSSTEQALDGFQGNGLFTHTLLRGLIDPEVDGNGDGRVGAVELGGYARDLTSAISKDMGFEQRPVIINFGRDMDLCMAP